MTLRDGQIKPAVGQRRAHRLADGGIGRVRDRAPGIVLQPGVAARQHQARVQQGQAQPGALQSLVRRIQGALRGWVLARR